MSKLRLAVLISGRGSNLQALIDACKDPAYPAEIAVVIANTPQAQGLARAYDAQVPAMIVDHTYFKGDKPGFENTLAQVAEQHGAQLICLAGFMRILGPTFLKRFKDKVINIHPSLLPKHKGLDTHASVLEAGDATSGCSVHLVTEGMDEGPVIAQRDVPVKPGDTAETLAARVLTEEHILYPAVVRGIAEGNIRISNGQVIHKNTPAAVAASPRIGHYGVEDSRKTPRETVMSMPHSDAAHHHPAPAHSTSEAAPEALAHSQYVWSSFTKATIIAGGLVALLLVLMAAFLV